MWQARPGALYAKRAVQGMDRMTTAERNSERRAHMLSLTEFAAFERKFPDDPGSAEAARAYDRQIAVLQFSIARLEAHQGCAD